MFDNDKSDLCACLSVSTQLLDYTLLSLKLLHKWTAILISQSELVNYKHANNHTEYFVVFALFTPDYLAARLKVVTQSLKNPYEH